jgi:hypothetical protein
VTGGSRVETIDARLGPMRWIPPRNAVIATTVETSVSAMIQAQPAAPNENESGPPTMPARAKAPAAPAQTSALRARGSSAWLRVSAASTNTAYVTAAPSASAAPSGSIEPGAPPASTRMTPPEARTSASTRRLVARSRPRSTAPARTMPG